MTTDRNVDASTLSLAELQQRPNLRGTLLWQAQHGDEPARDLLARAKAEKSAKDLEIRARADILAALQAPAQS